MRNNWTVSVIYDNNAFSSVLAMGNKSEMNRKLVAMLWSLFGFEMETVVAPFPRCVIVLVFRAVLYMFVRYLMASDCMFFRCMMFMQSCPVESLFVLFEIGNHTCK